MAAGANDADLIRTVEVVITAGSGVTVPVDGRQVVSTGIDFQMFNRHGEKVYRYERQIKNNEG